MLSYMTSKEKQLVTLQNFFKTFAVDDLRISPLRKLSNCRLNNRTMCE